MPIWAWRERLQRCRAWKFGWKDAFSSSSSDGQSNILRKCYARDYMSVSKRRAYQIELSQVSKICAAIFRSSAVCLKSSRSPKNLTKRMYNLTAMTRPKCV